MSSSPPRSPLNTPTRTPLQDRTRSQSNRLPLQPFQSKDEGPYQDVYAASPFPSKPQHVLLPSVLRKQKSQRTLGIDASRSDFAPEIQSAPPVPRQPAIRLKRSVKTLRDMYEAQTDDSRPSTPLSTGVRSRPGSSSSRLRSFSSSEGLSGRFAWEQFKNAATDDTALLPSLPEDVPTLRQIESTSSFAARSADLVPPSSPNYRLIGGTSSPRPTISKRVVDSSSDPVDDPSTDPSSVEQNSSSSPNVMRHRQNSSLEGLSAVDEHSSPNVVKLGTSSPTRNVVHLPAATTLDDIQSSEPFSSPNIVKLGTTSPARSYQGFEGTSSLRRVPSDASEVSRKRKRNADVDGRSFAERADAAKPFPSSSPPDSDDSEYANFRSSPPEPPITRTKSVLLHSPDATSPRDYQSFAFDQSSVAERHGELQAALSSSPAPPIRYPVVRAPAPAQSLSLNVAKRHYRSSMTTESSTEASGSRWTSRLSGVPSQAVVSRNTSKRSSIWEDTDESFLSSDDVEAAATYIVQNESNGSQIRIIPENERHDEADDEVMGLPGDAYRYRPDGTHLYRNESYTGAPSTSQSRLNSLQSSVENRLNSLSSQRPSLRRPSSSGSLASVVVPTWARRYYSGMFQDSFRYLMPSSSAVNVTQAPSQLQPPRVSKPESILTTNTTNTPSSRRPSFSSLRSAFSEKLPALMRPRNRPRLTAKKSHTMPGRGPLVSHPVRGPATAAILSEKPSQTSIRSGLRNVSVPSHPADPRAHWGGSLRGRTHHGGETIPYMHGAMPFPIPVRRMGRIPSISPHLHHDHRLNTDSTISRGYGHPFNRHSRYSNPSDMFLDDRDTGAPGRALRNWQVVCFMLGFICPLAWFIGAVLPLPQRPDAFADVEKGHWHRASVHGRLTQREAMAVLHNLRQEKNAKGGEELNWQNAKWWRSLNRWMCLVGAIILILMIVFAVLGTNGGL